MEITFIGANCRKGVSEKTGNAYEISELVYAIPDEDGHKRNEDGSTRWVYTGVGFRTLSLPLDPSKVRDFQGCELGKVYPVSLEPQPDNPSRNWVTGLAK
jgi:hypothetical protein